MIRNSHLILYFLVYLFLFILFHILFLFIDPHIWQFQFVFSLLNFLFLFILIAYLKNLQFSINYSNRCWIGLFIGFILINIIPIYQELSFHDNGFVPFWSQVEQVKFGLPFTYLRLPHKYVEGHFSELENYYLRLDLVLANLNSVILVFVLLVHFKLYKVE